VASVLFQSISCYLGQNHRVKLCPLGDSVPDDGPDRQVHLLLRLQSEGEITAERAAELIGTTEDVWQEILDSAQTLNEE